MVYIGIATVNLICKAMQLYAEAEFGVCAASELPNCNNSIPGAVDAAAQCPQGNERFVVCITGSAKGGCRPFNSGAFPAAACSSQCFV